MLLPDAVQLTHTHALWLLKGETWILVAVRYKANRHASEESDEVHL